MEEDCKKTKTPYCLGDSNKDTVADVGSIETEGNTITVKDIGNEDLPVC